MAELKITEDFFKLKNGMDKLQKEAPGKAIEVLDKAGNKVRREVKKATPVGKTKKPNNKRLKNKWKLDPTIKENGVYTKKLRSNAPHFHLVERGHKVVPRKIRKGRKANRVQLKKGKSYVSGTYFFDKAMDSLEPEIYNMYEELIDTTMKEVFGEWE